MIPRQQGGAYCSVHNGNFIPVFGRYQLVAAWYGGGTGVIDLTNPTQPHEIAYYDATVGRLRRHLVVVLVQRHDLRERHRARHRCLHAREHEHRRRDLGPPERADAGNAARPPGPAPGFG